MAKPAAKPASAKTATAATKVQEDDDLEEEGDEGEVVVVERGSALRYPDKGRPPPLHYLLFLCSLHTRKCARTIGAVTWISHHRPLTSNRKRGQGDGQTEYLCHFEGATIVLLAEWCQEDELFDCEGLMQRAVPYVSKSSKKKKSKVKRV